MINRALGDIKNVSSHSHWLFASLPALALFTNI